MSKQKYFSILYLDLYMKFFNLFLFKIRFFLFNFEILFESESIFKQHGKYSID